MIVKNLILRNNFQRLLSKYFKQKHLPPRLSKSYEVFCVSYIENQTIGSIWFNLPYPLLLFTFSG